MFVNCLRQVFIFQIRIWLSFGTHDKFKGCRRRLLIFVFAEKKLAEVIHSSKEQQNLLVKLGWKYVNNVWYLKTTENWLVSRYDILTYPSKMKLNFRKGLANTFIFSEFRSQFFSWTLTSWHACVINKHSTAFLHIDETKGMSIRKRFLWVQLLFHLENVFVACKFCKYFRGKHFLARIRK